MQNSSQIITTNEPTLNVLQAGCPSFRPTNSVKALKGLLVLNAFLLYPTFQRWCSFVHIGSTGDDYENRKLACLPAFFQDNSDQPVPDQTKYT